MEPATEVLATGAKYLPISPSLINAEHYMSINIYAVAHSLACLVSFPTFFLAAQTLRTSIPC